MNNISNDNRIINEKRDLINMKNNNVKNKKISKRVKNEDFKIPNINEYEKLDAFNYNMKQLKTICKHYKLKVSGNKNVLNTRIIKFMFQSIQAIKIQKIFRKYIVKEYIHIHGPALFDRGLCVNSSDFYTLDDISDIPFAQFYSFKDSDDFIYGFDVCSLYNYWKINKHNVKNPYNRNSIPDKVIVNDLRKMYKYGNILGIKTIIEIESDKKDMNPEQELNNNFMTLFQRIDELGFYTEHNWVLSLNHTRRVHYIRHIYDIWMYRANLSNQIKHLICPNRGTPFLGLNLANLNDNSNYELLRKIYSIMDKLINSAQEVSNRWLGTSFALTALTLVSTNAANALPWLYESAV